MSMLFLSSCKDDKKDTVAEEEENTKAKSMLQGIWLDDEDGEVTAKIKGDTIFYADSTMTPVAFAVIGDSLVLKGYNEVRYAIVKQTSNLFQFKNTTGDIVKLVKSNDSNDSYFFDNVKPIELNQNQLIKRDSVVFVGDNKYHVYTQVNPSTFKVISTSINDDGVQVDNVYYDNIINVCVYNGGNRIFSSDIHKQDLKKYVPQDYLAQAVLSDIVLDKVSPNGIEMLASVCKPNSPTSYIVRMSISPTGKLTLSRDQ